MSCCSPYVSQVLRLLCWGTYIIHTIRHGTERYLLNDQGNNSTIVSDGGVANQG